jgi:hypothetical protein
VLSILPPCVTYFILSVTGLCVGSLYQYRQRGTPVEAV